jgi:hypothetical protein
MGEGAQATDRRSLAGVGQSPVEVFYGRARYGSRAAGPCGVWGGAPQGRAVMGQGPQALAGRGAEPLRSHTDFYLTKSKAIFETDRSVFPFVRT